MGTQQVIIETVRTLAMHHLVSKVVVYINGPIPTYAIDRLGQSRAEFVQAPHGSDFNPPLCDIAYRPYQALSSDDVAFLRKTGRWTSINQLDNIAFSNPAYFASSRDWMRYRDTARLCLSTVDGVAYLSGASMHEALSEGLVPAGTSQKVVYTGSQFDPITNSEMPRELKGKSGPFLFVLGASYHHKNRPFAVRAVVEMLKRGWQGTLILAGPTPPAGSSLGLEAAEFLADGDLRSSVVQLASLSESQKRWIFENASLMLYPTIVEGFGLVPFEAANYGLATLSTRQGSLNEILPTDIDAIGGLTMGADPVAYGVSAVVATQGRNLRSFSVRKESKDHGVTGRIAGALQPGDRVAIVEDTVTRGTSIFEAVEVVREFGAIPAFISVIVDRGGTCAEMARNAGVPYVPMLTAPDLGFEFGS
jgi:orotate phosphoribosyltransferase